MWKSKSMFLCLCFVILGCDAVSFIDKCEWHNKECLLQSTLKALPHLAHGSEELGSPPIDPLTLDQVQYHEGDLKVIFKTMTLTGLANCKVTDVERNLGESTIELKADCPIDVKGTYSASGNLFTTPLEGEGPFLVKSNKIHIEVKATLTPVDGADGQKHWKVSVADYSYEPIEKTALEFSNLFNGDPAKAKSAEAIKEIIDQNWKGLVETVGKPIVKEIIYKIVSKIEEFSLKVPISDLEIAV